MLDNVVLIFHVLTCVFLILIVLMQPSKSDGMGAFGGGGGNSSSIFGGAGASPFLRKLTTLTAIVFMLNSAALAYLSTQQESVFADEIKKMKAEQKAQKNSAGTGMVTPKEQAPAETKKEESSEVENPSSTNQADTAEKKEPASKTDVGESNAVNESDTKAVDPATSEKNEGEAQPAAK